MVHETRFDEPVKRGEVFALLDRLTDVMRPKEGETGSGDKEETDAHPERAAHFQYEKRAAAI